jgi:hypothetical protein
MTYLATMALLLTATLAGCGREPLPQAGNTIRFSVAADYGLSVGTKAELVDLAGMQTGAIKLYGSMAGVTTPVFDGIALSYSTTDSRWSYAPVQYWIQNGVYDFRAVFPAAAGVTAGSAAEVKVNYSMATDNYDLMVASAPGISANTQAASGNPDVELAFQHACTAVRFLFKESDNNNDYYLKSMTLQGVNTSGTMTYNSTLAWSDYGTTAASLWSGSWSIAPTETEAYTGPGDGWHILPPQTSLDNAELVITYAVGNAENAQLLPVTIPLKYVDGTDSSKSVLAWDRAKTYTYKIELQANAISFDVAWTEWGTETEFDLTEE